MLFFPRMPSLTEIRRFSFAAFLFGAFLGSSSCASPLYSVAPVPKASPPDASTGAASGLEVAAAAMSEERALDQMDANLPLAGLIAVEVQISNRSSAPIPGGSLRATLHDPSGKRLSALAPKKALKKVMKFYGVRLYGVEAYARTIESYESVALNLGENIAPSESVHGVLFFDAKKSSKSTSGYTLTIEGGSGPITVQLN